jgi:hypothetical protein
VALRDARPDQAAHLLGKLLKTFGEDRLLWGTDSIWYGSPQDQIQAFRAFEIGRELQERHGYPALTPLVKRKVFGLNAARVYGLEPDALRRKLRADPIERRKTEYRNDPRPTLRPTARATAPSSWRSGAGTASCRERGASAGLALVDVAVAVAIGAPRLSRSPAVDAQPASTTRRGRRAPSAAEEGRGRWSHCASLPHAESAPRVFAPARARASVGSRRGRGGSGSASKRSNPA